MADLINTRLFARVERSLRKRLHTDVKPHLMRAAMHARNEDEFLASAARLLLNAQERQDWLASWVTRRHVEAHDTTPADLDSTMPAALDSPLQHRFGMTPDQRDRLREALAYEMGPIADLLLENESQRADSVTELLTRLESHIEGETQRARFRSSADPFRPQPDA